MPPPSPCENRPSETWAIASPELIMPSSRIADAWWHHDGHVTDSHATRTCCLPDTFRPRAGWLLRQSDV